MNLLEMTDSTAVRKTAMTRKLTLGGVTKAYPVYQVRLDCLYYNDRNDRIATWLTQYNQNPENTPFEQLEQEAFNQVIERFIIESNPGAIEKTKNNIALVNQREPGVVLCDGRIIDGNRRFTCLRMIHQNDPEVNYFETVILDRQSASNQKQIKMLELSIQHGEEQRVEYNLIDLTIGAYHDIAETKLLTIQEYAESTGESAADVKKRLDIAELVIEFLAFMGIPKQYHAARELQVYSLFNEALPLLKRCETAQDREELKITIFNNILMNSIVDQRKFIRNIKKMMDENVYAPFIRRENRIHTKIAAARAQTQFRNVQDMEQFARAHADLAEDLAAAMDRSIVNMKKVQSRGKPSQSISKSLSALMDIDTDVIDILSKPERENLIRQLTKLNHTVAELNKVCLDEQPAEDLTEENIIRSGAASWEYPLVYCLNANKIITENAFGLVFSAMRYMAGQSESAVVRMFFADSDGDPLSNECEVTVSADQNVTVHFTLYAAAADLNACRLHIRTAAMNTDEAWLTLPFRINMKRGEGVS